MNAPLVKVTWDDAEDPDSGNTWHCQDEIADCAEQTTLVVSVGYKVSDTAKYITLAADWIERMQQFGRATKIPKGVIVSIEDLWTGTVIPTKKS